MGMNAGFNCWGSQYQSANNNPYNNELTKKYLCNQTGFLKNAKAAITFVGMAHQRL